MSRNSTRTIEAVGGIKQVIKQFGSITETIVGGQPGNNGEDLSSSILSNLNLEREYIDGRKYEIVYGIFRKYVESDSLAQAYSLLTMDAMKKFNTNLDDLFVEVASGIEFSDLGIALLNNYRPSTSQIAIRKAQTPNSFIGRHIIA
jgi:hypothetical protein|tara:strand:+ start:3330 stop:3767 length:438 start_codon:yes stop_codon:yes gene_type:complete